MSRIFWSDRAEADLTDIGRYWFAHSPAGAADLATRIDQAAEFLATMPGAGPAVGHSTAGKWRVRGADYVLIYRVTDRGIEILRVRHVREDRRPDR
jgi:toxin ParE1/3/4